MNLTENNWLRERIKERMKSLEFKAAFLCKDAEERNFTIKPDRLSKYLKGKPGGITDEQLLWIATRLGININITFGRPVLRKGRLKYEIPPYNELEAIKSLNRVFAK